MDSSWVAAMDSLAAGGVINFDAPAYILGTNPRYVGNPSLENLPLEDPQYFRGIKLKNVPDVDQFNNSGELPGQKKKTNVRNWILGGIGAIALITVGTLLYKGKIKIPESWKNKFKLPENWKIKPIKEWEIFKNIKMPDFSKMKKNISEFFSGMWKKIQTPFNWIKGKLGGKKPPVTT